MFLQPITSPTSKKSITLFPMNACNECLFLYLFTFVPRFLKKTGDSSTLASSDIFSSAFLMEGVVAFDIKFGLCPIPDINILLTSETESLDNSDNLLIKLVSPAFIISIPSLVTSLIPGGIAETLGCPLCKYILSTR